MGNQNHKELTTDSMLFPEEESEEINEWMEYSKRSWPYYPSYFPVTELQPIQPVYNTQEPHLTSNNRKRSVLIVNNDYRKNRDSLPRKAQRSYSMREELYMRNDNNNVLKSELKKRVENGNAEVDESEEDLDKDNNTGSPTGKVYIAMSHDPITRRLKVAIIKAKNLTCKHVIEGKDNCGINCGASFITVSLVEGNHVIDTYTTAIVNGFTEVLYYENFAFHLNQLNLRGLSVIITANHTNKQRFIKHTHIIGRVILNGLLVDGEVMDSHLVDVTMHPGCTLNKWHTLWTQK